MTAADALWQPIETAPKTGAARLLACPQSLVVIGFWGRNVQEGSYETWRDSGRWKPIYPTHWMLLPEPPK